ncbi:MAG: response regulator transcription factor [Verrucomicrobiaceae bacterium]|nr:response regulator transcription factor [Verrucomicrobiaceae bacterium]
MTILFAEDDPELARQVLTAMRGQGHAVTLCTNGKQALSLALNREWDVILMDVSMPGMDGFEVVKRVRSQGVVAPVIFITARADVADRVEGLAIGGDDYLTKPFAMAELAARVSALHRRFKRAPATNASSPLAPRGWRLDSVKRSVSIDGKAVELQPREWSLLDVFLNNEGRVLTKSYLLDEVWNIRFDPGTNVVDAAVFRLRKKLDPVEGPSHIETRRGEGYVFHRHDEV